jgi:hypothetical protein
MNNPLASVLEGLTSLGVIDSPNTFQTPVQLGGDLITLTLLPRARWQTLLNLDIITVSYVGYSVTMQ